MPEHHIAASGFATFHGKPLIGHKKNPACTMQSQFCLPCKKVLATAAQPGDRRASAEEIDMSFYGLTNTIDEDPTPAGKRSVRRSVRGSLIGYVAGRMWTNFGDAFDGEAQRRAEAWLAGEEG